MDAAKLEAAKHLLVMLRTPLFMMSKLDREDVLKKVREAGVTLEELVEVALASARG